MTSLVSAVEAGLALRASIRDAADATIGPTLGGFVAADPAAIPANLRPYQAGYRRVCDIYAATGAAGQGLVGPVLGAMCDPYLGADAPTFQPGSSPGFSGGQCATLYNFTSTVNSTFPGNGQPLSRPFTGQIRGPVTGVEITNISGNTWLVRIRGATNVGSNVNSLTAPTLTGLSFTPVSGGADDCGDPPTTPPRYPPTRPGPPPPPDFPYNPGGGGPTININVGSPTVNVNGTISVPINVGGNNIEGVAGEPGGQASGEPDGPDYESPGTPETPEAGGDEKDSNSPLICAVVRTRQINPAYGKEILGATQRRYNPPLARFRFKFSGGFTSDWIEIRDIDQVVCYCGCDSSVEADGYYIKWNRGNSGSVSPIRLKSRRE